MGEGQRDNHYTDMHAAMRGHGTLVPSGNILKARAVEHGSRIVAAPPDEIFVVLELPRGNLETIYPRSLVLPAVAAAVEVAFLAMRMHAHHTKWKDCDTCLTNPFLPQSMQHIGICDPSPCFCAQYSTNC